MSIQYEDFISRLPRAHDYGRYISGLCPFHEDRTTPSLLVFKDGWFRCLSANCNRHGTWKTLWNKLSGQPIQIKSERRTYWGTPTIKDYETLERLCYQSHIDLENFQTWAWYLEMRHLDDAIEVAELGYHRGWYTIPVWDRQHEFVTCVFRSAPHVQERVGVRYWCNHEPVMYVPDWKLLSKPKYIMVVFGMFDALTLNRYRYPVVTSTAGADTFQAGWLDEWRRPIYILPDKGEERTAKELAGKLGWRGNVHLLNYPEGCKDANDFLVHNKEKELLCQLERVDVA